MELGKHLSRDAARFWGSNKDGLDQGGAVVGGGRGRDLSTV